MFRCAPIHRLAKRFMWTAQNGVCYLCGQPLPRKWASPKLTFEHIWPVSRIAGGDTFEGNVMLAHHKCNVGKANRLPHPCELIYLAAVNLRLGFREHEASVWDRAI